MNDVTAPSPHTPDILARQAAMGLLCRASTEELQRGIAAIGEKGARLVRGPETGLVMLRGRSGGDGAPFNAGEATVTRATVRIDSGEVGHSYALGRDHDKARLGAIADAFWQRADLRPTIEAEILAPVRARLAAAEQTRREKVAATRVDFFTLVRGDD